MKLAKFTPRSRKTTSTTPGFDQIWSTYPHVHQRSSKKEAMDVWRRLQLEPYAENIKVWVSACAQDPLWQDGCVPGLQVWLKRYDFSEPPEQHSGKVRQTLPDDVLQQKLGELEQW